MRILVLIITIIGFQLAGNCQLKTQLKVNTTEENKAYWDNWLNNLSEMGVETTRDSIFVKPEVIKAMTDTAYRSVLYPATYQWPAAVALLQKMELKPAFWHLMNLYEKDTTNRSLILGTFIAYDSLLDMSKILLSTYYTYGFADPRVCRVNNNKPEIYRPDLLEQGLMRTREIVNNILASRELKATKPTQ